MNTTGITLHLPDGAYFIDLTPEKPSLLMGTVSETEGAPSIVEYSIPALPARATRVNIEQSADQSEWAHVATLTAETPASAAGFPPGSSFYLRARAIGPTGVETIGDVIHVR